MGTMVFSFRLPVYTMREVVIRTACQSEVNGFGSASPPILLIGSIAQRSSFLALYVVCVCVYTTGRSSLVVGRSVASQRHSKPGPMRLSHAQSPSSGISTMSRYLSSSCPCCSASPSGFFGVTTTSCTSLYWNMFLSRKMPTAGCIRPC